MDHVNAASAETVWLVFHKDSTIPVSVHSLILTVFAKSERDARVTVAQIHREGMSGVRPLSGCGGEGIAR